LEPSGGDSRTYCKQSNYSSTPPELKVRGLQTERDRNGSRLYV
jgi:hypothetical protein